MLNIWNDKISFVLRVDRNINLIVILTEFDSQSFSNASENKVKRIRVIKENINNKRKKIFFLSQGVIKIKLCQLGS